MAETAFLPHTACETSRIVGGSPAVLRLLASHDVTPERPA